MNFYTQQLDYTIESVEGRMDLVNSILAEDYDLAMFFYNGNLRARKVVEKLANYVLFAYKGDKAVEKEFTIDTKHKSYKRKSAESLDSLLETPTFDENRIDELKKPVYKKAKETISEQDLEDIAELGEIREEIEKLELILQFNKEKNVYPIPPGIPVLTDFQIYKWTHMIISMRRNQYMVKDSEKPKTNSKAHLTPKLPTHTGWRSTAGVGVDISNTSIPTINFGNPDHIYLLLNNYAKLLDECWEEVDSDLRYLIWELEDYIDATELPPSRRHILIRKIEKMDNSDISQELYDKFDLSYNPNYISTIWKHEICEKIAQTAILQYKEWVYRDTPGMWKECRQCGEKKLKDTMNFGRKRNSYDGFNRICKKCVRKG